MNARLHIPNVRRVDWTAEEYHAHPAISRSKVVEVVRRPDRYRGRYEDGELTDEETKALVFGRLFHMRLLEPERWANEIAVCPFKEFRRSTKKVDAWACEVEAEGKTPVAKCDADLIEAMATSALREPRSDDITRRLLQGALAKGRAEQAYTWTDPATGLECKVLLDLVAGRRIIDLKTTSEKDVDKVVYSARKWLYHVQDAFYTEPLRLLGERPTFLLIFVLKEPPHELVSVRFDDELRAEGRELMRRGLDEIAARRQSGDWTAEWSKRPITVGRRGWIQ